MWYANLFLSTLIWPSSILLHLFLEKGSWTGYRGLFNRGGNWEKDTKPVARLKAVENMNDKEISSAETDGHPDGFQFALPFLDLPSRLSVEMLNKSLREAMKDPLLWVDLTVKGTACKSLTNEFLLNLVERAGGHLKSLFLLDALRITDDALSIISISNPGLERISVPGCTGLNAENFVSLIEAHSLRARAKGLPGISQVRLGGLYSISPEHLLRLRHAVGLSGRPQSEESPSCNYYGNCQGHGEATDKRPMDVEMCPYCENVRLIYDCPHPRKLSDVNDEEYFIYEYDEMLPGVCVNGKPCRACRVCIPRCEMCGGCAETILTRKSGWTEEHCVPCWRDMICTAFKVKRIQNQQTGNLGR